MKQKRQSFGGIGYIMREKALEVLRLWELQISKAGISVAVKIHRKTVRDYIHRAKAAGVKSSDLEDMPEDKYQ